MSPGPEALRYVPMSLRLEGDLSALRQVVPRQRLRALPVS